MKLIIPAFILSIIIHILFLVTFQIKEEKPKKKLETKKVIKKVPNSSVRYVKLKPKTKQKSEVTKQKKIETLTEKLKEIKKVEKNKQSIKKVQTKKTSSLEKKQNKKKESKKIVKKSKKPQIIFEKKQKDIEKRSLENFLLKEPIPLDKELLDEITKSYLKLYGEEYNSFTKVQKVFIQNSIKTIVQITRNYYRFPDIAIKLRKNDFNIVEFILHPNGDISNLKIVKKGNYSFYDKSILETIEIAYKDYPRPKEPTKIKFYITYTVY